VSTLIPRAAFREIALPELLGPGHRLLVETVVAAFVPSEEQYGLPLRIECLEHAIGSALALDSELSQAMT